MALINGTNAANLLSGTTENDQINGLGGDDIIRISLGIDEVDGGTGTDTLSFHVSNSTDVLQVNLVDGNYVLTHSGPSSASGTLASIERLDVTGGISDEFLQGAAGNDIIRGGGGADKLSCGTGEDLLLGGSGNDILSRFHSPNPFLPIFEGITASKTVVDGGGGRDTAFIDLRASTLDHQIDLADALGTLVLDGGLTLKSIEMFGLFRMGSGQDDIAVAGAAGNIESGAGDDIVRIDTRQLLNPDGVFINGGAGNDLLVVDGTGAGSSGAIVASTAFVSISDGVTTGGGSVSGVEALKVIGTGGNDRLTGADMADEFNGSGGADTLAGGRGGDNLSGGADNDTISGGNGTDTLDGGTGNDALAGGSDGSRDVYVFLADYDRDRISSYEQGVDRIRIDDGLWTDTAPGLSPLQVIDQFGTLDATGKTLRLNFGEGDVLTIVSVAKLNLATLGADFEIV